MLRHQFLDVIIDLFQVKILGMLQVKLHNGRSVGSRIKQRHALIGTITSWPLVEMLKLGPIGPRTRNQLARQVARQTVGGRVLGERMIHDALLAGQRYRLLSLVVRHNDDVAAALAAGSAPALDKLDERVDAGVADDQVAVGDVDALLQDGGADQQLAVAPMEVPIVTSVADPDNFDADPDLAVIKTGSGSDPRKNADPDPALCKIMYKLFITRNYL
jgi:hypothetical protein